MRFFGKIVCGVAAAALGGAAQAAVIDFGTGPSTALTTYVEDGYTVSRTAGGPGAVFVVYDAQQPNNRGIAFNGAGGTNDYFNITRTTQFSLESLAYYNICFSCQGGTLILTGYLGTVQVFSQQLALGGGRGTVTASSGIVDRLNFSFFGRDLTLDDIVLNDATAVPEPATWAMMIVGFGLAGAAVRRRRVAVA